MNELSPLSQGIIDHIQQQFDLRDKRIVELERELLFANDALAKGDLARQNAAGMEMKIQELEHELAESEKTCEEYRLLVPTTAQAMVYQSLLNKYETLERENVELNQQHSALMECWEKSGKKGEHSVWECLTSIVIERDQLCLQIVRLREFFTAIRVGDSHLRAIALANKALSKTSSQAAREVLEPVLWLLKRVAEYDRCNQGSIAKEITRLEKLSSP